MTAEKHTHEGAHTHTHLGVDAWLETKDEDASSEGFTSAARILAGEEPIDEGKHAERDTEQQN